jgi:DNA-binding transcriptional LysR family regulator
MGESEPAWDLYRTFLAVVHDGSFSAAARSLALAQPTVGRQIETLEAELGTSLFTRSPRGLIPTAAALERSPRRRLWPQPPLRCGGFHQETSRARPAPCG